MSLQRVRNVSSGGICQLDTTSPVGKGGEAIIFPVHGDPSLLAKIYHPPRNGVDKVRYWQERADKLKLMLANPPVNPTKTQHHEAYAWPTALISTNGGEINGFLMPRITGQRAVFDFYNPAQRRQTCALFSYRYLIQTARNIAGVMGAVHSKGYVIGDVNQKNVFVSDSALVTLLDTDSFQIRDPRTGYIHYCRMRTDGFIAPEGYRQGRTGVELKAEQDLFGLGVLIFHLLMEGVHPFGCLYLGSGEPPKPQQSIIAGNFPYGGRNSLCKPPPNAPPFEMLPDGIKSLFSRCFVGGHDDPTARPTAKEWQKALTEASKELTTCTVNKQHYYFAHVGACPWCARVRQRIPDSFPQKVEPKPSFTSPVTRPVPEQPSRLKTIRIWIGLAILALFLIRACL